ncbi:hypothetical protein HDU78_008571 [Chytriomyces hyalinus]|nr:hypothetical protein HDU78_008571 [Chytriomyces hyalinus]KAJ3249460.1 hypothetical protein HDU77_007711 [Chytriomyces hyalinus]
MNHLLFLALLAATSFLSAQSASPPSSTTSEPYDYSKTEVQRMKQFNHEDFITDLLHNPKSTEVGKGGSLAKMNLGSMPALARQGLAMVLINLNPCGANLPHVHPRASEAIYVIQGNVQVGFIEENGAKVIVNDLVQGQATFIPQGSIHYQVNLGCEQAVMIAANNNEDPGTLTIPAQFFKLPDGAIAASLGGTLDPEIRALNGSLPMNPAPGVEECLRRCGFGAYGTNNHPHSKFAAKFLQGTHRNQK